MRAEETLKVPTVPHCAVLEAPVLIPQTTAGPRWLQQILAAQAVISTGAKQMVVAESTVSLQDVHRHLSSTAFAAQVSSAPLSPYPRHLSGEGHFQGLASWLEGPSPHLRLQEFPAVGLKLL